MSAQTLGSRHRFVWNHRLGVKPPNADKRNSQRYLKHIRHFDHSSGTSDCKASGAGCNSDPQVHALHTVRTLQGPLMCTLRDFVCATMPAKGGGQPDVKTRLTAPPRCKPTV